MHTGMGLDMGMVRARVWVSVHCANRLSAIFSAFYIMAFCLGFDSTRHFQLLIKGIIDRMCSITYNESH